MNGIENEIQNPLLTTKKLKLIDRILDEAGYCAITWKFIFFCCFYVFVEGSQMTLTNTLFLPLSTIYQITNTDMMIHNSLFFLGVALGSILSGEISVKITKSRSLNFSMLILTILNTLSALVNNFVLFTILRVLIGFLTGSMLPVIFGICSEYLPIRNRGFALLSIWCFFGIGGLYTNISMLFIMPNLESENTYIIILLLSIPYGLFSLLYILYLQDGPRSLILKENEAEAIKILEEIRKKNLSDTEKLEIIDSVKQGINDKLNYSLSDLFCDKFIKTTAIQTFIWICFSYTFYGGIFSIALQLESLGFNNSNFIYKTITIYLFSMPGNLIGGIMIENKFLGRLKTCFIGYSSQVVSLLFIALFPSYFEYFVGLLGFFLNISFNVTSTYCSEYYPTKIRDFALGYFYFSTRVSAVISQIIALLIVQNSLIFQYIVILILTILSTIFVTLLPTETNDRPLDSD